VFALSRTNDPSLLCLSGVCRLDELLDKNWVHSQAVQGALKVRRQDRDHDGKRKGLLPEPVYLCVCRCKGRRWSGGRTGIMKVRGRGEEGAAARACVCVCMSVQGAQVVRRQNRGHDGERKGLLPEPVYVCV
jgi:hypothetical protein